MDRSLRDIERIWQADPDSHENQQRYLGALVRAAGQCVVQPVAESHGTCDCPAPVPPGQLISGRPDCRTYVGYRNPDAIHSSNISHNALTSLNGFFDHLVANDICSDHIPFVSQSNLEYICHQFCTMADDVPAPEGEMLLTAWGADAACEIIPPPEQEPWEKRSNYPQGIVLRVSDGSGEDRVWVKEAYVVPKDVSDFHDTLFYNTLDHFINPSPRVRGPGHHSRTSRSRGQAGRGGRGRGVSMPANLRGAISALLVSRKMAYRMASIAKYTIRGIEF